MSHSMLYFLWGDFVDFKLQKCRIQINVSRISNVHYFEFTNEYHTERDSHNFCELIYVDKGTLSVHADNFCGELAVNQLIIHRPNELHWLSTSDIVAPNVIIIGFECECDALIPFSKEPVTLSPEHTKALARIMAEGMSLYEPPYDIPNTTYLKKRREYPFGADQMIKIGLESFLISLVRDFCENKKSAEPTKAASLSNIQAIHQYITENYNTKITLDNLCFLFGTNKTTLCNSFRQEYGSTILSYINTLKIREAKALLRKNQMTSTQIAESLGYESVHYFCRQFKKATGQSPSEYSKSIRSKLNI